MHESQALNAFLKWKIGIFTTTDEIPKTISFWGLCILLDIKVKRKYLGALFSLLLIPGWHSFPYIGNCALTRFYFCKSIIQPPGPHVIWVNLEKSPVHKLTVATLGQKPTFYPEIPLILIFQKCEFCEKWYSRSVTFVKNEITERWILWKIRF